MTQVNIRNKGEIIGRLPRDIVVRTNADGSRKVLFTVIVDHDYTSRDGSRGSDAIPVEAFMSGNTSGLGPYENLHEGDLVLVSTRLKTDRYTKNGVEVFETKVESRGVEYLEPKSVTQARHQKKLAERLAAAQQENQQLTGQAPVAQPAVQPVDQAVAPVAEQAQAQTPAMPAQPAGFAPGGNTGQAAAPAFAGGPSNA